jgi:hypothetical protein
LHITMEQIQQKALAAHRQTRGDSVVRKSPVYRPG